MKAANWTSYKVCTQILYIKWMQNKLTPNLGIISHEISNCCAVNITTSNTEHIFRHLAHILTWQLRV